MAFIGIDFGWLKTSSFGRVPKSAFRETVVKGTANGE